MMKSRNANLHARAERSTPFRRGARVTGQLRACGSPALKGRDARYRDAKVATTGPAAQAILKATASRAMFLPRNEPCLFVAATRAVPAGAMWRMRPDTGEQRPPRFTKNRIPINVRGEARCCRAAC